MIGSNGRHSNMLHQEGLYYVVNGFHCTFHRQVTTATCAKTLSKVKNSALRYGVIGIDEGQFVSSLSMGGL